MIAITSFVGMMGTAGASDTDLLPLSRILAQSIIFTLLLVLSVLLLERQSHKKRWRYVMDKEQLQKLTERYGVEFAIGLANEEMREYHERTKSEKQRKIDDEWTLRERYGDDIYNSMTKSAEKDLVEKRQAGSTMRDAIAEAETAAKERRRRLLENL